MKRILVAGGLLFVLVTFVAFVFALIAHFSSFVIGPLWSVLLFVCIIPLFFALFSKLSVKELSLVTLVFIFLCASISLPLLGASKAAIGNSEGLLELALVSVDTFSVNPFTLLYSPLCADNVLMGSDAYRCPLEQFGLFVELLVLGLAGYLLVLGSLVAGLFVRRLRA